MQLESPSKVDSLYQVLKERICSGTWAVGKIIPAENDLAGEFGCSRPTISKVVSRLEHDGLVERRKRAGTRVLRSTKDRDQSAVELDAFAFIYPSEKHEGIWRTVKGFQDAAQEKGRRVVMLSSGSDFRKEIEFVSRLSEFDVRGAVVYPILLSAEEQVRFSQILLDVKFPVVLAELNLLGLDRPSVILDGYHAGYTMTRHLLARGCTKIGFFANYARVPSVRDRYLGYRVALEEAGISIEQQRIFLESEMNPDFSDPLLESARLARNYLANCGEIDGVVCVNDFLAVGMLQVATELGIKVPTALKVTGMEDFTISNTKKISLTTYHVPFEEMGRQAFERLSSLLEGSSGSSQETQIRGSLIIRKSS